MTSHRPATAPSIPVDGLGHPRPRLLVIDDQPVNIQLLHELFRDQCEVFMATSGDRGIALCVARQPDLVLLDAMMPGMDGYEVCRQLKANAHTADIPIIFVTANDDHQAETFAFSTGAVDYICKPLNPAVVRARVNTHVTLKRQSDLLKRMALTDGLTNVFNRLYFDTRMDIECRRSHRMQSPVSLLMIDVDEFKRYNDRAGHVNGDECLRRVATELRAGLQRPGDVVCRYGGEEFACVLPDTDEAGALHVAGQLIDRINRMALPHETSRHGHVTVSIGSATRAPDDPEPFESLVRRSDAALYRAKSAGRNRVVADGPTPCDSIHGQQQAGVVQPTHPPPPTS